MYLLFATLLLPTVLSSVRYVDQNKHVNGRRIGTLSRPFETIKDCVAAIEKAGDECQIRGGVYHEQVPIRGIHGTEERPVLISGYQDERPVLDGTVEITPKSGKWEKRGNVYSGEIEGGHIFWQLFLGKGTPEVGKKEDWTMMTNARWPDAKWSDRSVFNGDLWGQVGDASKTGKIHNRGNGLAESGLDMTDAIAVLNIGKFNTFVADRVKHRKDKNFFTYKHTFGEFKIEQKLSRYFFEDKVELVNAPEEWHFNKVTKILTFVLPEGTTLKDTVLRGKVQTYAMTITDSSYLTVKNLDFFGTTLEARSVDVREHVTNIRIDSNMFTYPSYSRRMLGEIGLIDTTVLDGKFKGKMCCGNFHIVNNVFYGTDGMALAYYGEKSLVEHNHFELNDWTSANMLTFGGGEATIHSGSTNDKIQYNTLVDNGNGVGIRPGRNSTVYMNRISGTCFGFQQNDGSGVQLSTKMQTNAHVLNNWVSDSPKFALRFDGEPPKIGVDGTVAYNVAWNTNGIIIKGNNHTIDHNLAFDKNGRDIVLVTPDGACTLCVWRRVRRNMVDCNEDSTTTFNIADFANGGVVYDKNGKKVKDASGKAQLWPLPGHVHDNILGVDVGHRDDVGSKMMEVDDQDLREAGPYSKSSLDVRTLLMDVDNLDFRPIRNGGADKMGAGPYTSTSRTYWIPGRRTTRPSSPVPPHAADKVKARYRDSLMWRNAYECNTHRVYFGTSERALRFLGMLEEDDNMIELKMRLRPGSAYFWRVDAVPMEGEEIQGDVWKFTTI